MATLTPPLTPLQGMIGGDVATLTVAFLRRMPAFNPKWDEKTPVRSVLETELGKV